MCCRPRKARRSACRIISSTNGAGLAKALELADKIADNAWLTNFAIMQALPRIAEQDRASGYVMEALMAAIAGGDEEAKARVKAFLEKRAPKVALK